MGLNRIWCPPRLHSWTFAFFLIYIDDLEDGIKSQINFFADDTSLFSVVNDPDASALDLNQNLNLISQWAYQWKISFNPDPTKQAVEFYFHVNLNK